MYWIFLLSLLTTSCENEFISSLWASAPDFRQIQDTRERKKRFISYFAPIVRSVNRDLLVDRERLIGIKKSLAEGKDISRTDRRFITEQARAYRVKNSGDNVARVEPVTLLELAQALVCHIDAVPQSLALFQAAKESGWGTSRFAQEANNFYGERCYSEGCGIVPLKRARGERYEIKSFASPKDSVRSYIKNLNTLWAYREFRALRCRLGARTGRVAELVDALEKYSERGEAYVTDIKKLISTNQHLLKSSL